MIWYISAGYLLKRLCQQAKIIILIFGMAHWPWQKPKKNLQTNKENGCLKYELISGIFTFKSTKNDIELNEMTTNNHRPSEWQRRVVDYNTNVVIFKMGNGKPWNFSYSHSELKIQCQSFSCTYSYVYIGQFYWI